jgi:hypothetical protein
MSGEVARYTLWGFLRAYPQVAPQSLALASNAFSWLETIHITETVGSREEHRAVASDRARPGGYGRS